MTDKRDETKTGSTELSEEDLDQAQGGLAKGGQLFPAGGGGLDLQKNQPTLQRPGKSVPDVDQWIPDVDEW